MSDKEYFPMPDLKSEPKPTLEEIVKKIHQYGACSYSCGLPDPRNHNTARRDAEAAQAMRNLIADIIAYGCNHE